MATVSDSIAATVTLKADGAIRDLSTLSKKAKETDRAFDSANKSIGASSGKAAAGIGRSGTAATKAGGSFKSFRGDLVGASAALGTIGLALGVVGTAGAGLVTTLNAASRLNEQISGSKAVFGQAAAVVRDFSRTTADGLGISAAAALKASSQFGALFKQAGFADAASARMSTTLVQLAGDLASFKDVGVDDALGAISSGLAGESEPLRRLGVDLRQTKIDGEALALGFANTRGEISETDRVTARYTSLLRQTGDAQGDAARTANSYANAQRRLTASTENFKAGLGQSLTNEASKALNTLNAVVKAVSTGTIKPIKDNFNNKGLLPETDLYAAAMKNYGDSVAKFGANSTQAKDALARLRVENDAAEKSAMVSGLAFESTARATARLREEQNQAVGSVQAFVGAQRGLEDATIRVADSRKSLSDAERSLGDLRAKGPVDAERVASAERSVADASRSVAAARRGVVDAERELAELRAGPSANESGDAARSVERAKLNLDRARKTLADAGSDGTGRMTGAERALERREAELGLADALDSLNDAQRAQIDLNARGAPGSRDVAVAEQRVADARLAEKDAAVRQLEVQRDLRIAQAGDPDFLRNLARANDDVTGARRALERAERDLPGATLAAKSAQDEFNGAIANGTPAAEELARVADLLAVSYDRVALAAGLARQAVGPDGRPGYRGPVPHGAAGDLSSLSFAGRAHGGPVSAGTPYIVGENRPELFVPDVPGRIVPRVPSSATAANGTGSQGTHYHFSAPLAAGLVEQIEYAGRLNDWRVGRSGRA